MNVCLIHPGNLYGGVETILTTLARYPGAAPDFHFALCFEGRLSEELAQLGAKVHLLGPVRCRKPWTVSRARRRLADLIRREGFDVVVCNSSWDQAVFGPVARRCGVPLVFWLHGPIVKMHLLDYWARLTKPDLLLAVSRHTAQTSRKLYRDVPVEVVYAPSAWRDGADGLSDRRAVRAVLDTSPDATVIIQASRMEGLKGHADHLQALARLRDLPGWVCWQVGGAQRPSEAAYEAGVKALAARLGIAERVRFLGQRSDVPELLRAADIYCQPNRGPEGFSIAFIEALSAGLPVVTSDLGGAPEVIDGACGTLTPPGDVAAVSDALRRLIGSPDLRRQLGEAGKARAEGLCNPARQVQRLREVLRALAGRPGTGPLPAEECRLS